MKILYLVRHGVAEDAAPGQSDADRALTSRGIKKLEKQGEILKEAGVRIDRVVTSPLVRSRQTADILADALKQTIDEDRLLAPGCTLDDLSELLARYSEEHLMVVGHQPDFGDLVHDLTGAVVKFRKGAIAVVDLRTVEKGGGILLGFYDPDLMIAMAGRS